MLGRLVTACLVSFLVAGFVVAGADPAAATVSTHGRAEAPPPGYKRLTNERVGYSLLYPPDGRSRDMSWPRSSQRPRDAMACERWTSSRRPTPAGARRDAPIARPGLLEAVDGSTLEGFMESTYGARLGPVRHAAGGRARIPDRRGRGHERDVLPPIGRLPAADGTRVAADHAKDALRSAQVRRILSSFTLTRHSYDACQRGLE